MSSSSFVNRKVIQTTDLFVSVVAHHGTAHGTKEIRVSRTEKIKVCKVYHTISCDVHSKMRNQARIEGITVTPTTVFLGPDGKELFRKRGLLDPAPLLKLMKKALKAVPGPKVPLKMWNFVQAQLKKGEEALGNEDWKGAINAFKTIRGLKPKSLRALGQEGLDKVDEKGKDLVEEAEEQFEVNPREALATLRKIIYDFRGCECAKEAAKLWKKLKKKS